MKQGSCIHENSENLSVKGFEGSRKKENIENIEKKEKSFFENFYWKIYIFLSFLDDLKVLDFN